VLQVKPAIRSKRRVLLSEDAVLLHDIARPHTATHSVENFKKLNFEVLELPTYSPDFAPSVYHLFGPLKQALRDRRITTDQQLKETVYAWLVSQPKLFILKT
jgi:hypothetical protein